MNFASDMDGTLTNQNIGDYINAGVTDKEYLKDIASKFTPKKGVDILTKTGLAPIIITGRKEDLRDVTVKWLRSHNIPFSELIMMPDSTAKFSWSKYLNFKIVEHKKHNVRFALDDKLSVINSLKSVGIPAFQVKDNFASALIRAIVSTK